MKTHKKFKEMEVPVFGPDIYRKDKIGSFMSYPDYGHKMVPNRIWNQKLKMSGYTRGRSSVKIEFSDESTGKYVGDMFVSSFINAAEFTTAGVVLDGWWCIVKRGANYGIEFLGEQ